MVLYIYVSFFSVAMQLQSLKLKVRTSKMDGWYFYLFLLGPSAYFQGR